MKYWSILIITCCIFGNDVSTVSMKNYLTLKIDALKEARGCLRIAIFNREEDFLQTDKAIYLKVLEVNDLQPIEFHIEELQQGEYAVAIFHDLNNNGRLDTNWLGIPKEPYAFSNDAGKKWKKPSFHEAKIPLKAAQTIVELQLKSWNDY